MTRAKTPAYAYLRVSGKTQLKGDGFPRQLAAIRAYAATNAVEIAGVYQERGVSGKADPTEDLASRPAWIEMLTAIVTNGVKMIVIEKLERLARDLLVQEYILIDLRRRGVTLLSAAPAEVDLCENEPSRKLYRQLMGAIAEYDRAMLVLKLRAARVRKGTPGGRYPFGRDPRRPDEADTLKLIVALRAEGLNRSAITRRLNDEGRKSRDGKRWQPRVVDRILTKEPR